MKRAVLMLVCLLIVLAFLVPAVGLATQATPQTTAATTTAGALIVYPAPPPDATAAEAKASTEWQKSGDLSNLLYALIGLTASAGIIVWGILASRKVTIV